MPCCFLLINSLGASLQCKPVCSIPRKYNSFSFSSSGYLTSSLEIVECSAGILMLHRCVLTAGNSVRIPYFRFKNVLPLEESRRTHQRRKQHLTSPTLNFEPLSPRGTSSLSSSHGRMSAEYFPTRAFKIKYLLGCQYIGVMARVKHNVSLEMDDARC